MVTQLNKVGYTKLIAEDIEWLMRQPRTLEREHIKDVLDWSISALYPKTASPESRRGDESKSMA